MQPSALCEALRPTVHTVRQRCNGLMLHGLTPAARGPLLAAVHERGNSDNNGAVEVSGG
jgi:hypothetical protein